MKLPNQPTHYVDGVRRFVKNRIVEYLLDNGPFDLNDIIRLEDITDEEHAQFAQLIGYSVSGWEGLSYVTDEKALSIEPAQEPMTYEEIAQALRLKGYMLHITNDHEMASDLLRTVREKVKQPVVAVCRYGKWSAQYPEGSETWTVLTGDHHPTEVHALAAVLLDES